MDGAVLAIQRGQLLLYTADKRLCEAYASSHAKRPSSHSANRLPSYNAKCLPV